MRHRSKKQSKLYEERRRVVELMIDSYPWCEACPILARYDDKVLYQRRLSVDVHELVPRSGGGSIIDHKNLLSVCRSCHQWIGDHPAEAQTLGLNMPSWTRDDMWEQAKAVRESWLTDNPTYPPWLPTVPDEQ